jgi:hypothetical protein
MSINKALGSWQAASVYQHVSRLDNPTNDATLMAATLRTLGFTLVRNGALTDLDKGQFDAAVQTLEIGWSEPTWLSSATQATAYSFGNWTILPTTAKEGASPFSAGKWTQGEVLANSAQQDLRRDHRRSSTRATCIGDHQLTARSLSE